MPDSDAAEPTEEASAATTVDGVAVDRRSPEATFALLADDTRVAVLRALGETPDDAVPFSRLRERVGIRDSGQFNYHLAKLVGSFVRKTEDGYELTHAGRQIVGAMYAGTYTANATVDPIPVDGECPLCGGDIVAAYGEETARMDCLDCDDWHNSFSFPPGSLDGFDREDLPAAFDRWMGHLLRGIVAGFCNTCAGRVDGRLILDDPEDRIAGLHGHVEFECGRCGSTATASAMIPAIFHPAVEGFLYDHGFDPQREGSWRLGSAVGLPESEVRSEDPPRLATTLSHDGESVTVVIEADATVSTVRRQSGGF